MAEDTLSAGTVSLGVKPDTTNFGATLKNEILGHTNGVGRNMGEMILGGLKTMAGPIAAVTAAFSVKNVIEDSLKAFEDLAGNTKQLGRVIGGTSEQVSGLRGAMQLSGVEADKASVIMTMFSKKIGAAAGDTKKAADMTALLGTKFLDAHGNILPMATLLPKVADKFASMPDGIEKTALATQLFGRNGRDLLPMLNKGSAGIADLEAKAKTLGLTLDTSAMAAFSDSRQSAREFAAAIQGLQVSLGRDLLPVVDAVQNVFRHALLPVIQLGTDFLKAHAGQFEALGQVINVFGQKVITDLQPFFKGLGDFLSGSGPQFQALKNILGPIFTTIGDGFRQMAPVFKSLLPQIMQLASAFSPLGLTFKALQPILPSLIKLLTDLAVSIGTTLSGVLKEILPPITDVVQVLVGAWSGVMVQLMPTIILLAKTLAADLGEVIKELAPVVVMLVKAIASLIPPLMPIITDIIKLTIDAIMPLANAIMPLIKSILPPLVDLLKSLMPIVVPLAQFLATVLAVAVDLLVRALTFLIPIVVSVISWFVKMTGAVVETGAKIMKWFTDLPGAIWKLLAGAGQWLVDTGKNIVDGLLNGIRNSWNTVVSWITGGVTDLVNSVKKMFGIKSPSTVFHEIGTNINQGLANGLYESTPWAVNAIQAMSAKVVGTAKDMLNQVLALQAQAISIAGSDSALSAVVYSNLQTGMSAAQSLATATASLANPLTVGGMDVTALVAQAQAAANSATGGFDLWVNPTTGQHGAAQGGLTAADMGLGAGWVQVTSGGSTTGAVSGSGSSSSSSSSGSSSTMIPMLANGGVVPATPGGRLVRIGEGREAEAVIPLSKLKGDYGRGANTTIHYHAAPNDSIDSERKLIDAVQRAKVLGAMS